MFRIFDNNGYLIDTELNEYNEEVATVFLGKIGNGLNLFKTFYIANVADDKLIGIGESDEYDLRLYWDFNNDTVSEICLCDFVENTTTKKERSSLKLDYDNGPVLNKHTERYESYDIRVNTFDQIASFNVLFEPSKDSNSLTFERTLLITRDDEVLVRLSLIAESTAEDERCKALCSNLNIPLDGEDTVIFADTDIYEPNPDWELINKKRRELLATVNETQYYIGSYKAVMNIIKFFGWNDVFISEFWQDVNINSDNYRKYFKVDKYDTSVRFGRTKMKSNRTAIPSKHFRKTNKIALVYRVTKPNERFDADYLPEIDYVLKYPIEDITVKLFKLKDKINEHYMPINNKICDVIGECTYFTRMTMGNNHQATNALNLEYGVKRLNFSVYPKQNIYITDDRIFFSNILDNKDKVLDADNVSEKGWGDYNTNTLESLFDDNVTLKDIIERTTDKVIYNNSDNNYTNLLNSTIDMTKGYINLRGNSNWIELGMTEQSTRIVSENNKKYVSEFHRFVEEFGTDYYTNHYDKHVYGYFRKSNGTNGVSWCVSTAESFDDERMHPISAKCVLKYDNFTNSKNFHESQFTWDECDEHITWQQQEDNCEVITIKWVIKHTNRMWIYKGCVDDLSELFLRLPYIGSYDVALEVTDSNGVITRKVKEKYINVLPLNVNVTGVYQIDPDSNIDDEIYNERNHNEADKLKLVLSDISDADIYDAIPYYYDQSENVEDQDVSIALSAKHIWDAEPVIETKPFTRDMENLLLERYMNTKYNKPLDTDMMTIFPSEPSVAFCPIPEVEQRIVFANGKLCDVIELELVNGDIGYFPLTFTNGTNKSVDGADIQVETIDWEDVTGRLNLERDSVFANFTWSVNNIPTAIMSDNKSPYKFEYIKTNFAADGSVKSKVNQPTGKGLCCVGRYKTSKLDVKSLSIIPSEYVKYIKIDDETLSSVTSSGMIYYNKIDLEYKCDTDLGDGVKITKDEDFITITVGGSGITVNGVDYVPNKTEMPYSWCVLLLYRLIHYKADERYIFKVTKANFSENIDTIKWSAITSLNKATSNPFSTFNFVMGNPNSDTARYIHSHAMLYPYTWCILSTKSTNISGIKKIKWLIGKMDYSKNEVVYTTTNNLDDTQCVDILPILFKTDGSYYIKVLVTDANNNEYVYERNLITVKTYNAI